MAKEQLRPGIELEDLAGKTAIISGGTTGIGRATALLLASRGVKVLTFGRDPKSAKRVAEEMNRCGGEGYALVIDQSKEKDIKRLFEEADRKLGNLDILINNAAVGVESSQEGEWDDWEYGITTNVTGYVACCHEAVERMKKRKVGYIVNVGSMSADQREAQNDVYVATKAAVQAFSEALRKKINPEGIRVTLIEPGAVGTPMQQTPAARQREREREGTMLKPEDIAQCICFCLRQPPRCDIVTVQIRPTKQAI